MGLPASGATCKLTGLSIYQRPITDPCATETISTIDVSAFNAQNLNLVTGVAQTQTLRSTTNNGLTCTFLYQMVVTGPNPSLITLSGNNITFAASDVLSHAGLYSIAVKAQISPQTTWSADTTATFNYVNPCLTATMPASGTCPAAFSVGVGATQASSTFALFKDSVTTTKNNGTIICAQTVNFYAASAPSSIANETMHSKFTYAVNNSTSTSGTQTISAAPTLLAEVGTYDLNAVACVAANPTSCKVLCKVAVSVTNPCLSTKITGPTQVQNFVVFAGQNQTSNSSYTFSDSISEASALSTISYDFCGEKVFSFKINSGNTTLLSGNNTQNITFTPLANSTIFGTFPAKLLICMKDYPTICQKIDFNVTILAMPTLIAQKQPPYFQPALKDEIVNICPGQQKVLWKFQIPSPIDPNNGTITMKVSLNPSQFTFDETENTIEQTKEQNSPAIQTISITLSSGLDISATYSMDVEFICEVVTDQTQTNSTSPIFDFQKSQIKSQTKQKIWPLLYIRAVDFNGLMHIAFLQKMQIPDNLTEILNANISIDGKEYPNLNITVIPGKLSDMKLLHFTSQVVSFTESELTIQLDFQNKESVSIFSQCRDQIYVKIYGNKLFRDTNGFPIQQGIQLEPVYLPQITTVSAATLKQAEAQATKASQVATSFIASNFVFGVFIQPPMELMLGSIRHFQIIIHSMLLKLSYPALANTYFGVMMSLVTFQLIDFENFFNKVLKLDPNSDRNQPFTPQFDSMGYSNKYIIQNFGMLCFTILITPVIYLTVFLIQKKYPDADRLKLTWNRLMFYGSWIKLINETFLFLGVCAVLNCKYLSFDTYGDIVNSIFAIFCAIVINVFPFFVLIFFNIRKNYDKVLNNDEDFMARYGQVVQNLNFFRLGQKETLYPFFSLLRKLFLVYVVLFMQDQPVLSIFALMYQAITMITLVGYIPPYKSRLTNLLELANEAFVLLVCYHLITFTDFLSDVETREYVGYSLLASVILCIAINIGAVGYIMASLSFHELKVRYRKWRFYQDKRISMENKKNKTSLASLTQQNKENQNFSSEIQEENESSASQNRNESSEVQSYTELSDEENKKDQNNVYPKKNIKQPRFQQSVKTQKQQEFLLPQVEEVEDETEFITIVNQKVQEKAKQRSKIQKGQAKESLKQSQTQNQSKKNNQANNHQRQQQSKIANPVKPQVTKQRKFPDGMNENDMIAILNQQLQVEKQGKKAKSIKIQQQLQYQTMQQQDYSREKLNQEVNLQRKGLRAPRLEKAQNDMSIEKDEFQLEPYQTKVLPGDLWSRSKQYQPFDPNNMIELQQYPELYKGAQIYLALQPIKPSNLIQQESKNKSPPPSRLDITFKAPVQEVPAKQLHHKNKHSIDRSNNQHDILQDYSFRDQNQPNQYEEWNEANNFVSSKKGNQISNPNQNYSQNERQFFAAQPKITNKSNTNVANMKIVPISANCNVLAFSTPAEGQLYNQQTGNTVNYFYTNDAGEQFQFAYPILAKPKPQLNQDDALSKLTEVLKFLGQQGRQQFEEMFEEVSPHIQLELAQLFTEMNGRDPPNFKQFKQKLFQISQPVDGLYEYAMYWSKLNSESARFAEHNDIDFESAVDYRSNKIPDIIQRFIKLQIENDQKLHQARFGQEPIQKNLAFKQLPPYELFFTSVHDKVVWYKVLIKDKTIRHFYPEFFEDL